MLVTNSLQDLGVNAQKHDDEGKCTRCGAVAAEKKSFEARNVCQTRSTGFGLALHLTWQQHRPKTADPEACLADLAFGQQ